MTSTCYASHRCILMWWRVCGRRILSLFVLMVVHVVCCSILLTVFIPSIHFLFLRTPTPSHPQKKGFNRLQEALRKDVERLYGVMTARFHILLHPGRFGSVEHMMLAGKAVAILHNMVVEQRRGRYVAHERMAAVAAARDGEPVAAADDGLAVGAGDVGWAGNTGTGAAAAGDVESAAAAGGDPFAGAVGQGGAGADGAAGAAAGLGAAAAAAGDR